MVEAHWLPLCAPLRVLPTITRRMITGVVTDDRQAVIHLTLRGPAGQEQQIKAIIDTGFDGWLSVPSSVVARLGLIWRGRGRALSPDGSESVFDIYEATVDWDGKARRIPVDEAETVPLVGMPLLEGYELTVRVHWQWSSLWRLLWENEKPSDILSQWPMERPKDWIEFVTEPKRESELEDLRSSAQRRRPLGSEDWMIKIAKLLGFESTLHSRGRPKSS